MCVACGHHVCDISAVGYSTLACYMSLTRRVVWHDASGRPIPAGQGGVRCALST